MWKEEKYERKGYFQSLDLQGARMMFRLAGNMFPARGNFPSLYRKDTLACQSCANLNRNGTDNITIVENQNHLAFECPAFQDLRDSGLDLVNSDRHRNILYRGESEAYGIGKKPRTFHERSLEKT